MKATESEFISAWAKYGSATAVSNALGIGVRKVHERRRNIENRLGIVLQSRFAAGGQEIGIMHRTHAGRIDLSIDNGVVIVFSDAHYIPKVKTTAQRALISMIRQLKPVAVIANGDMFDGSAISRFPQMQWMETRFSVKDELDAVVENLTEIEQEAKGAHLIWPLGNHDSRYEARLAAVAPEYEGIANFHLKDHFPLWKPCWTTWINDEVLICHRHRNGVHATHTNVQANHCSTVTGHLHSLKVTPYTDGRGVTKYGVDTGTLADPDGSQFMDYLEGRTPNWRSGFAVLTFRDGQMLMPELVMKHDEDSVQFRGHILNADTGAIV